MLFFFFFNDYYRGVPVHYDEGQTYGVYGWSAGGAVGVGGVKAFYVTRGGAEKLLTYVAGNNWDAFDAWLPGVACAAQTMRVVKEDHKREKITKTKTKRGPSFSGGWDEAAETVPGPPIKCCSVTNRV